MLRADVIKACLHMLAKRKSSIMVDLFDLEESLKTETKSSVGDKHETARARMHNEQAQLQKLQLEVKAQIDAVEKLIPHKSKDMVSIGNLVHTNNGIFFVAIALGKVQLGERSIQVISGNSPLSKKLLGKQNGEQFELNTTMYRIELIE